MSFSGVLTHIHIATAASDDMQTCATATLEAGIGIVGDRYATRRGTYSARHHIDRQVTLIESETLEGLARDHSVSLEPHEHRRNMTTVGVPLNHLVGRYFVVGDVVMFGGRLNIPCAYLQDLLDKKVFRPLVHRSGLNARIIVGGTVSVGQRIEPIAVSEVDPTLVSANDVHGLTPVPD